jgi:TolB-like protein
LKKLILIALILTSTLFSEQKNVAILPFDAVGVSEQESQVLTNKLGSEMVKLGTYAILDRSEMKNILKEQGFQQSGCTSSECAIEVGQILGVAYMVSGSIGKLEDIYYVEIKLIDVTTSKILKNVDRSVEGGLKNVLIQAIPQIAAELSGKAVTTPQKEVLQPYQQNAYNGRPISNSTVKISTYNKGSWIYVNGERVGKNEVVILLEKGDYKITEREDGSKNVLYSEDVFVNGMSSEKVELGGDLVEFCVAPSLAVPTSGGEDVSAFAAIGFHMGWSIRRSNYLGYNFHINLPEYESGEEQDNFYIGGFFTYLKEWDIKRILKLGAGVSAGFRYIEIDKYSDSYSSSNSYDPYNSYDSYNSYYSSSYNYIDYYRYEWGGPTVRMGIGYKKVFFTTSLLFSFGLEEYNSNYDDDYGYNTNFSVTPEFNFMAYFTL